MSITIESKNYDNYIEYKKDYDKYYREKNKEKIIKRNKEKYTPEYWKEQYQKRKDYQKEYYKNKRLNNDEWRKNNNEKNKEYKEKNKITLAEKTKQYKKTYQGKKSHKISEWKTKHGLKGTKEHIDEIFNKWYYCETCELCDKDIKKNKCMDHHHSSGYFRFICCITCNNYLGSIDRKKNIVLLELHKYFINNNIKY